MWQEMQANPENLRFEQAKKNAANVPKQGERGDYTSGMFLADFPQFTQSGAESGTPASLVPGAMLDLFISQANESVLPSRWGSMWRYAAGLYTAHFSTLYLKTYAPGSRNAAQAAGRAMQAGTVKSSSMGDTSVSYDNSAVTAGTEKWGAWNATQYGSQLVTMARLVGMGGMYVI